MSDTAIYGVFGAGGFGRETMPVACAMLAQVGVGPQQLVFIDDGDVPDVINGHRVLSSRDFLDYPVSCRYFNVAIADSVIREKLARQLLAANALPFAIKSIHALDLGNNQIGQGAILAPFSFVSVNVKVGDFFQADMYASVTHDCVVGDFVTFAPKAQCNGAVLIEDHVYVGSGAIIRNSTPGRKITIGRGAVIGMGAVVTKSVPAGITVAGNPAVILERA